MANATRLEKLVLSEISGVDDPANAAPGFAIFKSGEDADAEALLMEFAAGMEAMTKASDSKAPYGDVVYADPGYQEDGKKRYPLDTETHIRAAWSYISQDDNAKAYAADDLKKVKARIAAAMKKIGADVASDTTTKSSETASDQGATTILGRLMSRLGGKETDLEMDRVELEGILKERDEALLAGVAAVVKGLLPEASTEETETVEATDEVTAEETVEKDATDDGTTNEEVEETVEKAADETPVVEEVATETAVALTVEDVAKAISEALAPHTELAEAVLTRLEAVENRFAGVARKSLEGQEGATTENETPSTPTVKSAFASALAGNKVELR